MVGIRDVQPNTVALEHLEIVVDPQTRIQDGTILIKDGQIVAVGPSVDVPAGAERLDRSGHIAYPGFIDAFSEVEIPQPSDSAGAPHWNANILPQRNASSVAASSVIDGSELRSQGITLQVIAPNNGIVKGSSAILLTGDGDSGRVLVGETGWQHATLTVPRRRGGSRLDAYPNSPMGATALLRQVFYDANWYTKALQAYRANSSLPRPEKDVALEAIAKAAANGVWVIDAANERMAERADDLSKEFDLDIILRGSGREYRQLDEIVAAGHPILVPIDFPDAPEITDAIDAREVSLEDLLEWDLAPSNPNRLAESGLTICLTTDGLSSPDKFLAQVRAAVEAGLSPEHALAALTLNPARLLGIEDMVGTIQPGRMANLVVMDGDVFTSEAKTIETWVAGDRYEVTKPEPKELKLWAGEWIVAGELEAVGETESLQLSLNAKGKSLEGNVIELDEDADEEEDADDDDDDDDDDDEDEGEDEEELESVSLKNLVLGPDQLVASLDLSKIDEDWMGGVSWLNVIYTVVDDHVQVEAASLRLPNGETLAVSITAASDSDEEDDDADDNADDDEEDGEEDDSETSVPEIDVVYPLGAYGRTDAPEASDWVMFRGGTVWTCGPLGVLEKGDVLIHHGKVAAVGPSLQVPDGCRVIDVTGKHVTPGLIDCHSHMATDGGVNESGQTITAEVRIGDFIDNSDITIYRQLAGGLTTSNILHGSANPIGGQNQVIKLRWGATMDAMRFSGAPKGIKFALGENVKRTEGRYPDTRMGVEQIIRDQLLAAREYAAAHELYSEGDRSMLPPRIDLQLEALAEVLAGDRWIHCHSYRQDEIVALLDVLDEMGVTIGSLQHILEGYKVADRMAEHGATASSFSDWWAYKFEVYDAIPYNGKVMHDQGVIVSYNSDDRELARHMNTEAAKAVKYGGVTPEEALKFVTLNPAKQLRIDDRVGSLEEGKDADLVIWSGDPLSTMTRCEQTWIDGCQYFSLTADQKTRERDAGWHAYLVQKALGSDGAASGARRPRVEEEDRWHRHDIYCLHHDHEEGEHAAGSAGALDNELRHEESH